MGCTVTFDKDKCDVIYNGNVILRGFKDSATDLWTLPIDAHMLTSLPSRLLIPAGILHIPAGFLLEQFQLKERRSFCEGTLKKGRTDREGTSQNSFLF